MNGHRIAVISDTHNLLRPEVAEVLKTCEVVLHGGDISGTQTLEMIRGASCQVGGAGNFYVVRGNNDRDWAADIPYTLEVTLFGRRFFMTHKKKTFRRTWTRMWSFTATATGMRRSIRTVPFSSIRAAADPDALVRRSRWRCSRSRIRPRAIRRIRSSSVLEAVICYWRGNRSKDSDAMASRLRRSRFLTARSRLLRR